MTKTKVMPRVLSMHKIGGWRGLWERERNADPPTKYVGRRGSGMHYGNPFSHRGFGKVRVDTAQEAVDKFDKWLDNDNTQIEPERRKWILANLDKLKGCDLVCWCGAICHGNVLRRRAN